MAWRSHGRSNVELVEKLQKNGLIRSERVKEAMLAVDRADFCKSGPYEDRPQTIQCNATISAPHMHAEALEVLVDHIQPGAKVLDIGSGSGYLTACFAVLTGPEGKVVGVEHMHTLVEQSIINLRVHHGNLFDSGVIRIVEGDGRLGWPPEAPYDAIHVGAAAPEVPQHLVDQLKIGGRLIIPVGTKYQEFLQVDRINEDQICTKKLMDVIYVPLTSKEHQMDR